ncbi:MAG TPA: hypothetical protein VHW43_08240 [Puia sp.]|nr:hypothetical protein [Puia sp.]
MKRFYAVIFATFTFAGIVHAGGPVAGTPVLTSASVLTPASAVAPAAGPKNNNAREWQKENDVVLGHIRAAKLAAMKNTSSSIMSLFHDSILTEGVNPVWHGEYFSAVNGGPQVHFGVRCVFNNDDNTTTDNDLTVFANDISPLLGNLLVNGNKYTTVKAATSVRGNQYFEFDMENNLHVKAWLVTADGAALPYTPVTRREYLEQARKELDGLKEVVVAGDRGKIRVRTAAEQEAEKQQMLEHLKASYSGAELEARTRVYLRNYIKDEDLVLQTIARDVAGYKNTIRLIDSLLRNSTAAQLAQPAVVSVTAENFQGFEDGKTGTTTLVRMNPAYFTNGDEQAPKCLLICWRYNPADAVAAGIDNQLNANFAGQSFQGLLSK